MIHGAPAKHAGIALSLKILIRSYFDPPVRLITWFSLYGAENDNKKTDLEITEVALI